MRGIASGGFRGENAGMDPREELIAEIERLQRQIQDALDYVRRLREKALRGGLSKPMGRAEEALESDEPPNSASTRLRDAQSGPRPGVC